jgi:SRSO17 transposase
VFKIVRVPAILDPFFGSLTKEFHWKQGDYFRLLVLAIAMAYGRRNVSNLYRHIDAVTHRTRFNNFFLVGRWDGPERLRTKADELLADLELKRGERVYLILDDSVSRKRGKQMEGVGYLHDPVHGGSVLGHQYVTAVIKARGVVIPFGIRLYVKKELAQTGHARAVDVEFRTLTEMAALLIREFVPPAGIEVMVLFDSYYLCPKVVAACREKGFHYVSVLKKNRNLWTKNGRKVKAGSHGLRVYRRHEKQHLKNSGGNRKAHFSLVDGGWMNVSGLGSHHAVFSRKGRDPQILGIVTDHPRLTAKQIVCAYSERWGIEVFFKDAKQLLGLGQYQNGSYAAAVTHLHLVCFAYALLTHLRLKGEKGKRTRTHAAPWPSTSEAQNELRRLLWRDLVAHLEEQPSGTSFVKELERLLVA